MKKQIQEFIAQNRQNIIDDWRDLVNMEGSCRQPDAMHTIADWLCEKFQQAGVDCQVYRVRDEVPPVVAGVIGADRPGTPVIFTGHFDTVFDPNTFGPNHFTPQPLYAYGPDAWISEGGNWSDDPVLIPQGFQAQVFARKAGKGGGSSGG